MKFSAVALSLLSASASAATIGSYESVNDVSAMTSMGPDLDAIGDALAAGDMDTAKTIYENGQGSTISFQSLSLDGTPLQPYSDYYGSATYGDEYIQAAFAGGQFGSSDFSGFGNEGKEQVIKKAAAYMNAYMAAIENAVAALGSCSSDADAAVTSWDKTAALFYGASGEIVYAMGEKRCKNFGTCVDGEAAVNTEIFSNLNAGQAALQSGDCDGANAAAGNIVALMSVPLIQGVLRAAYKLDKEEGGEKELGYGTVFAAAVLPAIADCDADAAATIEANLSPTTSSTDFAAVKAAFEGQYGCLNISCEHVSGLVNDDGGFLMGAEPCGVAAPAAPGPAAAEPAMEEPAAESEPAMEEPADDSGASMAGVVGSAALASAAAAMLF